MGKASIVKVLAFFTHLSAMKGRSDLGFNPPKREPFKVLPSKRERKWIGTTSSVTEPMAIVFPFPYKNIPPTELTTLLQLIKRDSLNTT